MAANKNVTRVILLVTAVTLSLFLPAFTAMAAVNPGNEYYRVLPGDSLWLIGQKYQITPGVLMDLNNLNSTEIYPGQLLRITGGSGSTGNASEPLRYTVQRGDSLYLIGLKFGTNAAAISDANGLTSTVIYPGQLLAIPRQQQRQHIVKTGDTLYLIAKKYCTSIDALVRANSLKTAEIWPGQVLLLPPGSAGTPNDTGTPVLPDTGTRVPPDTWTPVPAEPGIPQPDTDDGGGDSGTTPLPVGGQWSPVPEGMVLYHVKSGETLWLLTQRFNTTQAAIMTTNHLHTDLLQVNQPLFIPQNSQSPVEIIYPEAPQKTGYGMLYDWEYVSWMLDTHNTAVLKDLLTGKSFQARRLGGSNHADMEPLTAADTSIMKEIFGGSWSWNRRAVLVYVDGKVIAGSMAGMPHDIQTIPDNDFPGHFDLHFLNSRTHNTNSIDPQHQAMVQKAAGN